MSGPQARREPNLDELERGVVAGDRTVLGRAITLVESQRPEHQDLAQDLLARFLPRTGNAWRIGVTGVPGVGKSTFIESFGLWLVERGHRVAVLAVDPSSQLSGGSILGDKTRMARLSTHDQAFVRPSPSGGTLGGVARRSRETLLVCEAAGYDVVLVETVGVGQAETVVAEMVDFVLLLLLPGAGDELQGIKRGILELIDMVAVNKADGDNQVAARRARTHYEAGLRFIRPSSPHWSPPVVTCSGLEGTGLDVIWEQIEEHRRVLTEHGDFEARRREQRRRCMWTLVEERLLETFRRHPRVAAVLEELEAKVASKEMTPATAAGRLLSGLQRFAKD